MLISDVIILQYLLSKNFPESETITDVLAVHDNLSAWFILLLDTYSCKKVKIYEALFWHIDITNWNFKITKYIWGKIFKTKNQYMKTMQLITLKSNSITITSVFRSTHNHGLYIWTKYG
jgi:hypothetical protein